MQTSHGDTTRPSPCSSFRSHFCSMRKMCSKLKALVIAGL